MVSGPRSIPMQKDRGYYTGVGDEGGWRAGWGVRQSEEPVEGENVQVGSCFKFNCSVCHACRWWCELCCRTFLLKKWEQCSVVLSRNGIAVPAEQQDLDTDGAWREKHLSRWYLDSGRAEEVLLLSCQQAEKGPGIWEANVCVLGTWRWSRMKCWQIFLSFQLLADE
jgi:hypothetical protein